METSRRISGERLSIETICRIIDRSVKKRKEKKGEKGEENRMHSCAREFLSAREFLFRESLSTRLFPREIPREREKERELLLVAGIGDLWTKIVGGTGADENISREN